MMGPTRRTGVSGARSDLQLEWRYATQATLKTNTDQSIFNKQENELICPREDQICLRGLTMALLVVCP